MHFGGQIGMARYVALWSVNNPLHSGGQIIFSYFTTYSHSAVWIGIVHWLALWSANKASLSSYNQKCYGCFFGTQCTYQTTESIGVMSSFQKIWKSKIISLQTKLRLLKALVWPVATHRWKLDFAEAWPMKNLCIWTEDFTGGHCASRGQPRDLTQCAARNANWPSAAQVCHETQARVLVLWTYATSRWMFGENSDSGMYWSTHCEVTFPLC